MLDFNFKNNPLSEASIEILYSANNIDYQLVELFNDFSQSLLLIVFNTYLGDEVTNSEEKINHFTWCWHKNLDNFKEEGIIFHDCDILYNYYLEFMLNFYYLVDKSNDLEEIIMANRFIWLSMFSYKKSKTTTEVDKFFKIYTLLENSLKNAKKG